MSGGSFLADLTLRVAPNSNDRGVSFACAVADPAAADFMPYVEQGVRSFVTRRASEGCEIGHLSVTLTAITIHLVDARGFGSVKRQKWP